MTDVGQRVIDAVARPASKGLARRAARVPLSGADLARMGMVLALLAAVWFSGGGARDALVGSLLLAVVLFTDLVGAELDGTPTDALGAWLTLLLMRLREYVVYVGLAVGGVMTGVATAWEWAAGALVALAVYESVVTARTAHACDGDGASAKSAAPGADHSPIAAMDPSRPEGGPTSSDPTLTAELFGGTPQPPPDEAAQHEPIRIRTAPHSTVDGDQWQEGRRRALRRMGLGAPREGGAYPAQRRRARVRLPRPPGHFPQPARFAVITLTITIWDVQVTFVALIIGCAVALSGELVGRAERHRAA